MVSGISQWRNSPAISPHDGDDLMLRFAHAYERRVARSTAELFVSYLHHEDLRFHPSNKTGAWRRTGAALMSVLSSPDADGHGRIALAPIAGALGWGLTSMALYQQKNTLADGLERTGFSYGAYFIRAMFHEFSPELWSLTPHFIQRHHKSLYRDTTF